jgi:catalase (peroxidase I)
VLTNDFFVNLYDMGTVWTATSEDEDEYRRPPTASRAP